MAKKKQESLKPEKHFPIWAKLVFAILFIAYTSVFLARQINFVTADLGRHITNGKIFFEEGKIISTNYYASQRCRYINTSTWTYGYIL